MDDFVIFLLLCTAVGVLLYGWFGNSDDSIAEDDKEHDAEIQKLIHRQDEDNDID